MRYPQSVHALLFIVASLAAQTALAEDQVQPNIIVINLDDAGYADFGFSGEGLIPTPNIDALARSGVICTRGYVTASVCTPSRMGLISGRYQQRFGAECNVPTVPTPGYTKEDLGLDVEQETLGDAMRASGYRTMAVGKWHLGVLPRYHPNERGFDEFYGFLGGSRSYFPIDKPRPDHQILRNHDAVSESEEFEYTTDAFTDATLEFIERNQKAPFFVYLAYNAVHGPLNALESDLEHYGDVSPQSRKALHAMTRAADRGVGKIVNQLGQLGIRENTLIFLVNDNGGATKATNNSPLRGFKGSKWEGGIRVPYVVSWPAGLPAGSRYDQPVSTLDILPTMLSAADSQWQPKNPLDGVDLLPHLKGQKTQSPSRQLFWRRWNTGAVIDGNWKLIRVMDDPLTE